MAPVALLMGPDISTVRGGVAYVSEVERKHSWPLAEVSGDTTP